MKLTRGRASPVDAAPALDRIDRAILKQLQQDASISNVRLAAREAERAGVPAARGAAQGDGVDPRHRCVARPEAARRRDAGRDRLVLDRSTPEAFAAFEKAAQKVSGCVECHVVTGEFDYFMLVRTRDNESFNRLHAEQLLYLPGVRQVRSFMVLKEILSTHALPI
jgi:DNA-binding Lrp family transcriptional regulator